MIYKNSIIDNKIQTLSISCIHGSDIHPNGMRLDFDSVTAKFTPLVNNNKSPLGIPKLSNKTQFRKVRELLLNCNKTCNKVSKIFRETYVNPTVRTEMSSIAIIISTQNIIQRNPRVNRFRVIK